MANPATVTDPRLAQYAGNTTVAQAWLDAVWRQLRLAVPGLQDRAAADADQSDAAGDVVISATLRVLRNPEGNKSASASIDDYTESFTRSDATMDVYFTAAELARLRGSSPEVDASFVGSIKYL